MESFAFRLSSLFTTTNLCRVRITGDTATIRLSSSRSILPSLVNKTTRYLNSSTWGRISSRPGEGTPPFSGWGPWTQIWRCWFSSRPLHTQLRTGPVRVGVHGLMKPTGPHHPQKAVTQSWGHQTGPLNVLAAPRNPVHKNDGSVTKGSPHLETSLTYYRQCGPSSDTGHTGNGQPVSGGPILRTPGEPPTGLPEGHGRMPNPSPQNTCGLVGQTPMHPQGSWRGCRAGPLFHDLGETHIAPPESEVRLSDGPSFPAPPNRPYQKGWGVWSPYSLEHTLRSPFLKRGTTT